MVQLEKVISGWHRIATYLSPPKGEQDLERLIELADLLVDKIGETENHELEGLLHLVGTLISDYEKMHFPEPEGTPIECLKFLMAEHGLKQKDMKEIGSPGVVSEIINGKRSLNKRQISELSKRFGCSPSVFF